MADRAAGIPIVREGAPFVAVLSGVTALAAALGWTTASIILGGITLFTGWFFRNPHRIIPTLEGAVVAPGDGKIIEIQEDYEPRFLKEDAIRVSLFLNIFDVHVNRVPCEGRIDNVVYQPGQFIAANRPAATLRNEQNALMIRAASGKKVLCVQVAGLIARRIVCWVSPGDTVQCGERYGLIRFGSRMDVYLPKGTLLRVRIGDHVKGGAHVLGVLPDRRTTCVEGS